MGYEAVLEEGRRLATERDDLIAAGVDPAELLVPLAPSLCECVNPEGDEDWCRTCGAWRKD